MTDVERWLQAALADVRARRIEAAAPVLEAVARALEILRAADWNDDASQPSKETRQ